MTANLSASDDFDVAIIGGGLVGAMAALSLRRRGLEVVVLEARPAGVGPKRVVGEALTEGTSVFLRHELGLDAWLRAHAYRKFGFDFLVRPRSGGLPETMPETMEDCHELLLSLTQLERLPRPLRRLIPTFHVQRPELDRHLVAAARAAGVVWREGASVERVVLGPRHVVHFAGPDGAPRTLGSRWVLDASGRRAMLGRQLGCLRASTELDTAAVWNRFEGVAAEPERWRTFHGIDRRRHTIHFSGPGFWIWWIHQSDTLTSVGISYDRAQHQPDVKSEDHGFGEMLRKFPPVAQALAGARPEGHFQYYAHLAYRCDHWLSSQRYALLGDASWFVDALYSIGIETACRQLAALLPLVEGSCRSPGALAERAVGRLNREFDECARTVETLNRFKYREAWHRPRVLFQTALYELGEIAELYHLQERARFRPAALARHYRLQWSTRARSRRLERFMRGALAGGDRDLEAGAPLLKKALLPGPVIYAATWPLWNVPGGRAVPYFFQLVRGWAYAERWAQRWRLFPDALSFMAAARPWSRRRVEEKRARAAG